MTMKINRHSFTGILCSIFLLSALTATFSGCSARDKEKQDKAKYIFLFIGDGMGASHVAAAESYLSYKAGKIGGEQLTFTGFPVLGTATTYSANRHITCSSAAGTAISCGEKTKNGYLCVDPEGNRLESITYKLKREGYKIGIMSTVPVNHATPAAFYGHNKSRYAFYEIAQEIPQSGFEFFAGDGFLDYYGHDGKNEPITGYLEENGVDVCFSKAQYEEDRDSAKQLVLCQPGSEDSDAEDYEVEDEAAEDFSLGEMLSTCLDFLGDSEPFFIMCEGGEIDWDAHDNMTMTMIDDIIELNGAVDVAYGFYQEHPDETLIIVTADHETGGIALGGPGGTSKKGNMIYWDVYEKYADEAKEGFDKDLNRKINTEANIGWTTTGHSGGPVPVYAIGKGSGRFSGRMDNTDISRRIMNVQETAK